MKEKFYTVKEVADILRVTPDAVTAAIRSGSLEASKVGKKWIVSETSLMEYLEKRTAPKSAHAPQAVLAEAVLYKANGNGNGNGHKQPPVKERPMPPVPAVPQPVPLPVRASHYTPPDPGPDPDAKNTIVYTHRMSGPLQYITEVLGIHGTVIPYVKRQDVAGRKLIIWGSLPLPEIASAAEVWFLQAEGISPDYRIDPSVEDLKRWKCRLVRYFIET